MATELAISQVDATITKRMLDVIKTGDLGRLTEAEQLAYYVHECGRMGLDPAARPLEWVKLQGKLTLYAKRTAGDMLAAKHDVSVAITDGPRVMDLAGTTLLFARAKAVMPTGRSVEDVATLPCTDLVNGVMKVTSKAIRRATLRLCGWGGLDESELETIPSVSVERVHVRDDHGPHAEPAQLDDPALDYVRENLDGVASVEHAAAVFFDAQESPGFGRVDSGVAEAARKILVDHLEGQGHKAVKSKLNALLRQGRKSLAQLEQAPFAHEITTHGSLTREEKLLEEFHASVEAAKSLDALVNAWRKHREDVAELLSAEEKAAAWEFAVQAASALEPPVTKAGLLAAVRRADNPTDEPPKGKRATKDAPADVQGSATPVAPVTAPQARVLRVEVDEATFAEAKARDFSAQSDKHAWALRLHRARNWKEMVSSFTKRADLFERRMLTNVRFEALVTAVARWDNTDEATAEKRVRDEIARQSPRKKVA